MSKHFKDSEYQPPSHDDGNIFGTSLTLVNPELGSTLMEAARAATKDRLTKQCVGEVESLMQIKIQIEQRIEQDSAKLKQVTLQLAAIEAGQVSVSNYAGRARIIYNDEKLNKDINDDSVQRQYANTQYGPFGAPPSA